MTDKKYWENKEKYGCSCCLLPYKLPDECDGAGKIKVNSSNPMHVCKDSGCSYNICHTCFTKKTAEESSSINKRRRHK